MTDYRRLRVALLGAGSVGSQVASLLLTHQDELADRAGAALDLVGIAVRRLAKDRTDLPVPADLFTTDAAAPVAVKIESWMSLRSSQKKAEFKVRRRSNHWDLKPIS